MVLDLEKIIRDKQEAEKAATKITWKPKKQRELEAAQKAKREEEERQARAAQEARDKEERERKWLQQSSAARGGGRGANGAPTEPRAMTDGGGGGGGGRDHPRHHGDRGGRWGGGDKGGGAKNESSRKDRDKKTGEKRSAADIEAALQRERYLGPEINEKSSFSASKKRRRATGNKFNFEWGSDEDTSRDADYGGARGGGGTVAAAVPIGAGFASVGGEYDDAAEERAKREADAIARLDPDPASGRRRARQLMEAFYKERDLDRQRRDRTGLGKHWSDKELHDMRERDWRIMREDFGIATKGGNIPNPIRRWDESGLPEWLLSIVARVGYADPTPIQRAAIPIALQARDLIGVAATGSGKTAAFLLPLLVYISDLPALTEYNKNDGPYGLIIAPTRELVQQIETEARKFAAPLGFNVVSLVGGHAMQEQLLSLRDGAEIIVATPGRLVDFLEQRLLVLTQCCYLIMDEADRMVDMGFDESLQKILGALPARNEKPDSEAAEDSRQMQPLLGDVVRYRQTMMYTATMPSQVERIAKQYLRRPAIVTVGNAGEAVETVEQRVEFISGEDKRKRRLVQILQSGEFQRPIIVFVNIKRNCDAVARDIKSAGFSVATMHGSKSQEQREASLLAVRHGQADVLVATDLAGRGIDVPDVSLVLNFNMALTIDSYTHRIGRTGRAGKKGVAITFVGNEDADVLYDLRQILGKSQISKVPDELKRHEAAQQKPSRMGKKSVLD
jgi:ATP-dependent RNA helicase DDX23/PRP28